MVKELEQYVNLINFFSETMGSTFEAGLYDLTDSSYPSIASSELDTSIIEEIRQFVAMAVKSNKVRAKGYVTNRAVQINFGKISRVSVYFIKNDEGEPVGALWFCVRCDLYMKMSAFATSMLKFNTADFTDEDEDMGKLGGITAGLEPSLDVITALINESGIKPYRMTQDDRMEIICDLFDTGVFKLKGAVARVAEELQVSEQSVYRYLTKLRNARE